MNPLQNIPILGSGIGFRKNLYNELVFDHSNIDFIEIIGEHYLNLSQSSKEEISELMSEYTIIPHFIGCSIGSAEGVDLNYIEKVAQFIDLIKPPYWSEHVSFTECHGVEIGHLTPLPYSQEALDVFSKNIEAIQSIIHTPLVLENITYAIQDPIQEMTEPQFLNQLFKENQNVGMLLDITNLFVNSSNHNFDSKEWLRELNTEQVLQIHYVGAEKRNGIWIDNHSSPTQDEIWQIMKEIKSLCPNLKASVLERDNHFESTNQLRQETKKAKSILFE